MPVIFYNARTFICLTTTVLFVPPVMMKQFYTSFGTVHLLMSAGLLIYFVREEFMSWMGFS